MRGLRSVGTLTCIGPYLLISRGVEGEEDVPRFRSFWRGDIVICASDVRSDLGQT